MSNLRRDINERVVEPAHQALLDEVFIKMVRDDLALREAELQATIRMSKAWNVL